MSHQPKLPTVNSTREFWTQHREASLNWIAFGLLLAAWNASDNTGPRASQRPESLRGYSQVSVRAASRIDGAS